LKGSEGVKGVKDSEKLRVKGEWKARARSLHAVEMTRRGAGMTVERVRDDSEKLSVKGKQDSCSHFDQREKSSHSIFA